MAEKEKDKSIVKHLLPGAIGGAAGTLATMPIDVTKDVMKQWRFSAEATPAQRAAAKNLYNTAKQIYKEKRLPGFFAGTTGSLAKIVPAMAITFAAGDIVRNKMEKKAAEKYQLEAKIFDKLPIGHTTFDKALLGRIGDKKVSGEEKDIAEHVPYEKKHKYLLERAMTNPIVAGVGAAGFAAAFHKYRAPVLRKAFDEYQKASKATTFGAETVKKMLANQLKNPKTGNVFSSIDEINKATIKTPKEVRKSMALSGLTAGGGVAVGRYLHPRALKGEAIMEREQYQQRYPSAYIRTRLRQDVELKRGEGVLTKKAVAKKTKRISLPGIAIGGVVGGAGLRYFKAKEIFNNQAKYVHKYMPLLANKGLSESQLMPALRKLLLSKLMATTMLGAVAGASIGNRVGVHISNKMTKKATVMMEKIAISPENAALAAGGIFANNLKGLRTLIKLKVLSPRQAEAAGGVMVDRITKFENQYIYPRDVNFQRRYKRVHQQMLAGPEKN